jgi:hypothetical protein
MALLLSGTRIYGTGTVDTQLFVNGTTTSISTTTGALQVAGGVGIGRDLYVGGTIFGTFAGAVSTASQINSVAQTSSATYYPAFVDSNNASATGESVYTTSSFYINPSTGSVNVANRLSLIATGSDGEITTSNGGWLRLNSAARVISVQPHYFNNGIATSLNHLPFLVNVDGGGGEKMRITTAGNVGIGTTTPASLLHVAGDARITGITTVTDTTQASDQTFSAVSSISIKL